MTAPRGDNESYARAILDVLKTRGSATRVEVFQDLERLWGPNKPLLLQIDHVLNNTLLKKDRRVAYHDEMRGYPNDRAGSRVVRVWRLIS
jgi:hypothetical protein